MIRPHETESKVIRKRDKFAEESSLKGLKVAGARNTFRQCSSSDQMGTRVFTVAGESLRTQA